MPRLPFMAREDLAPEQRHVYDDIAASRGNVDPNFAVLLNSPTAAATTMAGFMVGNRNRAFMGMGPPLQDGGLKCLGVVPQ